MRLAVLLLFAAPLSAQHIVATNISDSTPLNPLAVWEEAVAVIRQAQGLHAALSSGEFEFDISADACLSIRNQQRSGRAPALPASIPTLGSTTAECSVLLDEDYVRQSLEGWHYDWPASSGSDTTVCASMCDETSLETAIANASCGDTITVTANETVDLGTNLITVAKHCSEDAPLWIRTSAYANAAFGAGSRIGPGDASLMPKFTVSPNAEFLNITETLLPISAVDTGTDTLTTSTAHGLSVGDEVYFTDDATTPLNSGRTYWVLTVPTTTTLTVSKFENSGASTLDLTGTATGSIVQPSQWIRITGMNAGWNAGSHSGTLFDIEGAYQRPGARSNHIWLDHVMATHGFATDSRRRIVWLRGTHMAVTDSYLTGAEDNSDAQAILVGADNSGPTWIENNGLEATGENIMSGGVYGTNESTSPNDLGTLVTKGNYMWKDPAWKRTLVAGSPTTPCVPGEIWQDSTGAPDYYECDAGGASWSAATSGDYPGTYTMKNLFETKKSLGSLNLGNVYELSWASGGSQHGNLLTVKQTVNSQNNYSSNTRDALFYGETAKRGGMSLVAASVSDAGYFQPMGNIAFWNFLWEDIDNVLYDYRTNSKDANYVLQVTSIDEGGISFRHVTHDNDETGSDIAYMLTAKGSNVWERSNPQSIHDSIIGLTQILAAGTTAGCASLTSAVETNDVGANVWVWTDGAGNDLTSCSTTYYGETALSDVGFADEAAGDFRLTSAGTTNDYRAGSAQDASDGKDMGAATSRSSTI